MKLFSIRSALIFTLASSTFSLLAKPTVIHNVNGYTFSTDGHFSSFSSIAFEDGKVLNIGDNLSKLYPKANRVNGNGNTLLPGLIDAHGHMLGLGFNLLQVDVRDIKSASDTAKTVAQYAKQNPDQQWIIGRGWNQVLWPDKQFPTAKDLDEVISDRPVYLSRVDGHAAWLNTKAMELAGITSSTISPEGGEIVKDAQGKPTGVLIDNAESLIWEKMPKNTAKEREAALNKASAHLLSLGVTSMHDAGVDYDTYKLYKARAAANNLPVRIYGMISAADPQLEKMLSNGHVKDADDLLSMRSIKIYGDGALGSRGAAMLAPYHDDKDNKGLLVTQPKKLRQLYQQALAHNFQINTHAIGDRANRIALDEFEFAYQTRPNARKLRHRVEHAQVIHLDDIPRFKTLDIIPSMQPTHATSDKNMAADRIGSERLKGAYAWQTFLKQGSRVAAGSDFPVELANPFFGLHAAVSRQDRSNLPENGWLVHEAMTTKQALKAFTIDAAFAAHQESVLGGLEKGKWADFILIDSDIFNVDASQLWQPNVLQTWVAGEKVFQKD